MLQQSEKVCSLVVGFQRLYITLSAALNRVNATFQSRCPNYQKTAPANKKESEITSSHLGAYYWLVSNTKSSRSCH
jgi:hypothetical protein